MSTVNNQEYAQILVALEKFVQMINTKDNTIENLEKQITDLSKHNYVYENSELIKERDSLKINVQNLSKKIDSNDDHKKKYNKKIELINTLKIDMNRLKKELNTLSSSNLDLENENLELENEKDWLTSRSDDLVAKLKILTDNYNNIMNKNIELEKKIVQLSEKHFDTLRNCTDHRLTAEKYNFANQNLNKKYNILEKHSTGLENEIKDLETQLADISSLLE